MGTSEMFALFVAVVGCVWDLRTRRIPNVVTFGGAAAAIVFHLVTGGLAGLGTSLVGWAVGIGVMIVLYALGGLGAGYVKLLGALGAWLGPVGVVWVALYTGIAGGVLALIVATAHGYLGQAWRNIWYLLAYWRLAGI